MACSTRTKAVLVGVTAVIAIVLIAVSAAVLVFEGRTEYGILIDAGSSGCRIHIYSWPHRHSISDPVVSEITREYSDDPPKTRPGISSFTANPAGAGASLQPLLSFAQEALGADASSAQIYLFATAGMRLLSESDQAAILGAVRETLHASVFVFEDNNARVISGRDEGVFGWLTINYLIKAFGTPNSAAALDMGGASTQVTFQVSEPASALANETGTELVLAGTTYNLYTFSYLGYGMDQTHRAVVELIIADGVTDNKVTDPCLATGYSMWFIGNDGKNYTLLGSSDSAVCRARLETLMYKNQCDQESCGIGNLYMPTLPSSLYAFSGFYYTVSFYELVPQSTILDLSGAAQQLCQMTWPQIQEKYANAPNSTKEFLYIYCFQGSYIVTLLSSGYNLPEETSLEYVLTVDDVDATWALGAVITEADLYPVGADTRMLTLWYGAVLMTVGCVLLVVDILIGVTVFARWRKERVNHKYERI